MQPLESYLIKKEYTSTFLNEYLKLKYIQLEDYSLFKDMIKRGKENTE